MVEKIQKYLEELESERNIKILLACETGSRAWGFPSPDSDYDIRLVYIHSKDWYISVNQEKDTIELMLENNDIDISGWELRKSLQLLSKSNPPLLERIQSPILYSVDAEFKKDIFDLSTRCYSKIATIHHYLSMAKKMVESVDQKTTFNLKKFFYALRTSTLCRWIIERDEIPPIEFPLAYNNLNLDSKIVERIDQLIEIKSDKSEQYLHKDEPLLINFIMKSIAYAEEHKDSLAPGNCKTEELNTLLRKYINKYDR